MIVRLFRTGGFPPPANEKVVTVDDGRLAVWRSTDVSAAGSFVGQLSSADSGAIQALALRCVEAGDLTQAPAPDAAIDTVTLDGAKAEVGHLDRPDGPWRELLDLLRPLFDRTDEPHAAVGLQVAPGGDRASLRHLGAEVLRIDLSKLRVAASLRPAAGEAAGAWDAAPAADSGVIDVGPGWTFELPFDHGFATSTGTVTARVSLVIYEREHPVEVELAAASGRPSA